MSVLTLPAAPLASAAPVRPWLELYGVLLKPRPRQRRPELLELDELALIQRLLPEELMHAVFGHLGPYGLGAAACVCMQWRSLAEHPRHWQAACTQAIGPWHRDAVSSRESGRQRYRGCWRQLFLETPRVRFDGLYVSRNTYIRQGAPELRRERTCFLVTYYRYLRFYPDGWLLYRTSPLTVSRVARSLQPRAGPSALAATTSSSSTGGVRPAAPVKQQGEQQHVFAGRYVIKGGDAYAAVVYPNSRSTELRLRLHIRGLPCLAAANRLDIKQLVTFDRDDGSSADMLAADDQDLDDLPSAAGRLTNFQRGTSACVFVPWHEVATSPLNLAAREMDFFVTG